MSVVPTDMLVPIANGGTNATTKGGAVANLLTETLSIANCSNTASEITIASVTVPANTWANIEEVAIMLACTHRQFAGVPRNITLKAKAAGTSFTMLSASAVASNTTIGCSTRTYKFLRVGSEIWFEASRAAAGVGSCTVAGSAAAISTNQFGGVNNKFTGLDFTTDITLEITVQWSAADAQTYFNVNGGRAYKT